MAMSSTVSAANTLQNVFLRGQQSQPTNNNDDTQEMIRCKLLVRVDNTDADKDETVLCCELESDHTTYCLSPGSVVTGCISHEMDNGLLPNEVLEVDVNSQLFNEDLAEFSFGVETPDSCPNLRRRRLDNDADQRQLFNYRTMGEKSLLMVRVEAIGGSSTNTEQELRNSAFGAPINFQKQMEACSEGQFRLKPADDATGKSGSVRIANGVVTISVDAPHNTPHQTLMNKVTKALDNEFGNDVFRYADHLFYCLPAGAFAFGENAYATINGRVAWFNDEKCSYLSFQMHELGHNLGFGDATEAIDQVHSGYGDAQGAMGFVYNREFGPRTCYNPANFYQLEWYGDSGVRSGACQDEIDIIDQGFPTTIPLIGFAGDSSKCGPARKVVRIQHPSNLSHDLYVLFNWQTGYNSETSEAANQITVVTKPGGMLQTSKTSLEAKLSATESFTYTGGSYETNCNLKLTVKSIDTVDGNAELQIDGVGSGCSKFESNIGRQSSAPTPQPTSKPTNQPTSKPTNQPTSKPTNQPTSKPTNQPTSKPTNQPTSMPTNQPTNQPTSKPTNQPTSKPTNQTTSKPTNQPTSKPTNQPTSKPTNQPTSKPTNQPTSKPTNQPTSKPTEQPTSKPTNQPTPRPTNKPTSEPTPQLPLTETELKSCPDTSERAARFWHNGLLKRRWCSFITNKKKKFRATACDKPHIPSWPGAPRDKLVADICQNECVTPQALNERTSQPKCTHMDY